MFPLLSLLTLGYNHDAGFSTLLHLCVPFHNVSMGLSFFLLPIAVLSLYVFQLKGFIHSGRRKEFFCSPLTGLHFLFVCFPVSVMVTIIN